MVEQEDFQWIWAVLSAFDKSVALSDVLNYELPQAEDYNGVWTKPVLCSILWLELKSCPGIAP